MNLFRCRCRSDESIEQKLPSSFISQSHWALFSFWFFGEIDGTCAGTYWSKSIHPNLIKMVNRRNWTKEHINVNTYKDTHTRNCREVLVSIYVVEKERCWNDVKIITSHFMQQISTRTTHTLTHSWIYAIILLLSNAIHSRLAAHDTRTHTYVVSDALAQLFTVRCVCDLFVSLCVYPVF